MVVFGEGRTVVGVGSRITVAGVPMGNWKQLRLTLRASAIGAVSFWLPDLAVHLVAGRAFGAAEVYGLTLLLPLTFLGAYLPTSKLGARERAKRIGLKMLLGVLLSGGFFMMLAATPTGGGFSGDAHGTLILIICSVFPLVTYILAAYDGTLGALFLVTVGVLIVHFRSHSPRAGEDPNAVG